MTARLLSQLLYHAEGADPDQRDPCSYAEQYGLPRHPALSTFLSYLTHPGRDRRGFSRACEDVFDDESQQPFWRALAAHHRGLQAAKRRYRDADLYLPKALAFMSPVWGHPDKSQKDKVNPDASYIYHLRMRDRPRLKLAPLDPGMQVIGATTSIREGWFEAPRWTLDACHLLVVADQHNEAKRLIAALEARSHEPNCYFSPQQRAHLMRDHGQLLAA